MEEPAAQLIDDLVERFLAQYPIESTPDPELREARFDAGLAFPQFDIGHGGLGLDPAASRKVERAFLAAGAADWADRNVIGLGIAAPTLHTHGTDKQRALLRPLFTGEHIWCQLFSEPGSGSDLAGLATRAIPDGNEWVVNGQKVWTTLAHIARWGLLLVRSNPDVPKHCGLTYFVLDMASPGVEVRPLRQMTGEAEFNEVFLSEVRIPDENRLGKPGEGWRVALTTLMNERTSLPSVAKEPGQGPIARAVTLLHASDAPGRGGAVLRDRVADLWIRTEAARLTGLRAQELAARGTPGPEGSVGKLLMAELNKAVYELCVDLMGPAATLIDHYAPLRPEIASIHGGADVRKAFLRTRANSIEGGTSEVLSNILAERVLGLPNDPRDDRNRPWKDISRSGTSPLTFRTEPSW